MEKLLAWLKENLKDGVNFDEAKTLVDELIPQSKEDAEKLIDSNKALKSEIDSRISRSVDNALERYREKKEPELEKTIRERVQKELNPEETPEQKRIRELEEKLNTVERREQLETRRAGLRKKAAEIGYDPLMAEQFAAFGDDAESALIKNHEYIQGFIKTGLETETKKRFGGQPPAGSSKTVGISDNDKMIKEYNSLLEQGNAVGANLVYLQMQEQQNKE